MMNYPLIIIGSVLILIGSLMTITGSNWDKITGKSKDVSQGRMQQASSSGNQSPAINIQQNNYYSEPKDSKVSAPENKPQNQPIQNFASKYTLAADLNILNANVHVNGINVRGNVNVNDTEGVELKNMKIFKSEDYFKGKINIDRSQEFSIKNNTVANEINVDRSKTFEVTHNAVGGVEDQDKTAQDAMNIVLTDSSTPEKVMLNLLIIQKLIENNNMLANALGGRIEVLDKEKKGAYKAIILNHLNKLNAKTLSKAEDRGIGLVFHWLNFFLHFDLL